MRRTKIKTNNLPRITGAEAEFYNPYEHHKQNLNQSILFPKGDMNIYWDEGRSIFWNSEFGIKLPKKPAVPKSRTIDDRELPDFNLELVSATLFAELSVQSGKDLQEGWQANKDGVLVQAADETQTVHPMYKATIIDLIRTKYPEATYHICKKTQIMAFYTDELVGIMTPRKVHLTEYQIEQIVELGFDKTYHVNTEAEKEYC